MNERFQQNLYLIRETTPVSGHLVALKAATLPSTLNDFQFPQYFFRVQRHPGVRMDVEFYEAIGHFTTVCWEPPEGTCSCGD